LDTWRREVNVERFFVAGMLHDIGQLIMATVLGDLVREMIETSQADGELYFDVEIKRLGFDHAEVGGALLKNWKIPTNIADPVGFHHRPSRAEQFPLEASLIHLADIICQAFELGQSCERFVPPLDVAAWDRLGMPVNQLGAVLKQAEPQIEETFAILSEAV
jgi:HD-like signal output (HDOD) protein